MSGTSHLALLVPEEQQEVRAVAPVDDVEHPLAGLTVHHAGKDDVLHRVEDDGAVGLRGRLSIQSGAWSTGKIGQVC